MNLEKSERKSRRSSILKTPKPRQRFQNVELAVSNAENSPATTTTKIKRRVSFAEKKHVKEFCTLMEEGTVWDNTYEESEVSQMRNSETSSTDENIINNECKLLSTEKSKISTGTKTTKSLTQSINMDNEKDSRPIECYMNSGNSMSELTLTESSEILFPANNSESFPARRPLSENESVFGRSPNKEKPFLQKSSDSCPAKVSATSSAKESEKLANIFSPTTQNNDSNIISMHGTFIQNTSVEPTLPTPITLSKNAPILRTSFDVFSEIDFLKTNPISSIGSPCRGSETAENTIGPMDLNYCEPLRPKSQGTIMVYHDTSLEMTEAMSNRASIVSKLQPTLSNKQSNEEPVLVTEQKTIFQTKTIDTATEVLGLSKKDFEKLDQNEVDFPPERIPIFSNKSVQSQNVGEDILNINQPRELAGKTEIFHDEHVDITEVVQNIQQFEKPENIKPKETTVFHNKSLELTEAIQNVPSTCQLQKEPSDTISYDKSADLTGVIQNPPSMKEPERVSQEQTTLFHNQSPGSTEVVRSSDSDGNLQISSQKSLVETPIQDQFMDLTGDIRSSSSINSSEKAVPKKMMSFQNQPADTTQVLQTYENQPPEKTTIFHNHPVDITEVVRSCPIYEKPSPEKTTIFHDQSVEMTEVVHSRKSNEKPYEKKKSTFQNQATDLTENAQIWQTYEKPSSEETTTFHNQSVDMTEVVKSHKSNEKLLPEKKSTFQNQTTDTIENVRIWQTFEKPSSEKTTIFHDQSVEMTEVVHSHKSNEKLLPERKSTFQNQSTDTIENVRIWQTFEKPSSEKTTIFHNQSVDMTEVVKSHKSNEKVLPEKKSTFQNQATDITENVRNCKTYEKPSPEKTKIFHNQFVDITEVVHSRESYENSFPEKSSIFQNQPADITESVGSCQTYEKPSPEKTTIFHNQSVDMTEVVRSRKSYETPSLENTATFHDRLEIMTGPVQNRPSCKKSDSAKTTPFQKQSLDIIEVLQSHPVINESVNPVKTATFSDKSLETMELIPSVCSQNPIQKVCNLEDYNNVDMVHRNEPPENQLLELNEVISRVPSISKLKHKSHDSEEANKFTASIGGKTSDPEVRSPVSKKLKSREYRQSLDLTAAVPFVTNRKLARERPEDIKSISSNTPPDQVYCGTVSTPACFSNIAMDVQEVPVGSTNNDVVSTSLVRSGELVAEEARQGTINFQNRSMEMTEAIPFSYSSKSTAQVCTDSTDDADKQDHTICHDESMEITKVISGILNVNVATYHEGSVEFSEPLPHHPITENFPALNENHGNVINQPMYRSTDAVPTSKSGSMVCQNKSVELKSGSCSEPIKRCTNVENIRKPYSNVMADGEIDERTKVYCNNSMELTGAVQFLVQAPVQDKENCLLGMEYPQSRRSHKLKSPVQDKENCLPGMGYPQSRSSQKSEKERSIGISKNEWLEIMKSVSLKSSQEYEEIEAANIESETQSRDTRSEDISGVVPLPSSQESNCNDLELIESEIQRQKSDGCTSKEVESAIGSGVKESEMTERVRWSPVLNVEKSINVVDENNCQLRLPLIEAFPSPDKIQNRNSQVAKELFQKPVPSNRSKATNENLAATSETADLDAQIRKFAETFALSKSVDESGFDQATFLRQQARCMEDYEANSTASQEFHSGTMSTKNMSIIERMDHSDPSKSVSPVNTAANQNLVLPTENTVISPDSKTTNISIRNNKNPECNGPLTMNREDYDKSLEELRCRAQTVRQFQPEVTGFELTGAISLIDPASLHKSIFDEEPPSYIFSDIITTDAITDRSSLSGIPISSNPPISGKEIQDQMAVKTRYVSVTDIMESAKPLRNDKPEISQEINIAEEPITFEGDDTGTGISKNKNVDRAGRSQHSQTFVTKRSSAEVLVPSLTETETHSQRERLSGLTTAAEFSSESPDGPNEKIRRRESGSTIVGKTLPIVDKVDMDTELIKTGRSWGTKTFANSTVISEDYTLKFARKRIEETSAVLDRTFSHECLSEIVHGDDKTVDDRSGAEKAIEPTSEQDHVLKSPYTAFNETIESLAKRPETIWKIKRLDEQIAAFTFFSRSLVLAIYLKDNAIWNSTDPIEVIGLLSQLKEDGSPPNMCLAHRLIMKKISSAYLTDLYKTFEDIPRMLAYVTAEVKLGMDFMFELDRLSDYMIMDINGNSIKFTVRTRDINAGIILNITMEMKPFEQFNPDDITISYLLGQEKVSENDIKRLITNVKRDHRFLRNYINDVRSYIELMAESGFSVKKKTK